MADLDPSLVLIVHLRPCVYSSPAARFSAFFLAASTASSASFWLSIQRNVVGGYDVAEAASASANQKTSPGALRRQP